MAGEKEDENAAPAENPGTTLGERTEADRQAKLDTARLVEDNVRALARKEIETWQAERETKTFRLLDPKSWKNVSRASVGGAAAAALASGWLFLWEKTNQETDDIRWLAHKMLGTDQHISAELARIYTTDPFRGAVDTSILTHAQGKVDTTNPLLHLVTHAMNTRPVLAFHGQATFGRMRLVPQSGEDCDEAPVAHPLAPAGQYDHLAPPTIVEQKGLNLQDCLRKTPVEFEPALDIPFHARLYDGSEAKPVHQVSLVLFIDRHDRLENMRIPDHKRDNLPAGLCILYNPGAGYIADRYSVGQGLRLKRMIDQNNGFWTADITALVTEAEIGKDRKNSTDAAELLHSISIQQMKPSETVPSEPTPCDTVAAFDEQVSVRAVVLVNMSTGK